MADETRDHYGDAIGSLVDQSVRLAKVERERDEIRAEAERLREVGFTMLSKFVHPTYPGRDCRQSVHVPVERIAEWSAALRRADEIEATP